MPQQKPGKSESSVGTPTEFINAVEKRWGSIAVDLAADAENCKGKTFISAEMDSFKFDWGAMEGVLWLNPPYSNIEPWVKKASEDCKKPLVRQRRILVLIPASVGTNYFAKYIHGHARVYFLSPRLKFEGHKNPYPKDLILCVYGEDTGYEPWRWDVDREYPRIDVNSKI